MKKGQSLIEILIVIALLAMLIPPLFMTIISSRDGKRQQQKRFEAAALMKETQEALRIIRENGWSAVSNTGTYHPVLTGSTWNLSGGTDVANGLSRNVDVSNVYRLNNQIVSSGGSIDPSTIKITTTIAWTDPIPASISTTAYLTRYLENANYLQTTQPEFDTGTQNGTITTNDAGGEITLGAGGEGSWCTPDLTLAEADLPKSGVANALTAIENLAFAVTGENASGVAFARVVIDQTPSASVNGTFDGYKTNDVFGEQNYAYIATDNNSEEIVIINLSTMTRTGWFNAAGSINGDSVYVYNNRGYMTQGDTLRIFDLSSKSGERSQLGSITLPGNGTALVVQTSDSSIYAYVSISGSSTVEMQIVDVTNPASPELRGTANLDSQSAQDIAVNDTGTRAYVVTNGSSTQREFFIIDISTKTGARPTISNGYDTTGMSPKAVTIVPGNKAIVVGTGGQEYQVIELSQVDQGGNPTYCGGIEVNSGINDIASVLESDGDAYSYILTGDANSEFKIIEGGPGGTFTTSGYYESETFDAGYSTAFNRTIPNFNEPFNTTVRLQISVADSVSGSCNNVNFIFIGPDGTQNSYYSASSLIFFDDDGVGYENPGRCFRYRVYLDTSDSTSTPIFNDVSINYSP